MIIKFNHYEQEVEELLHITSPQQLHKGQFKSFFLQNNKDSTVQN